jgi:hypothetical protein
MYHLLDLDSFQNVSPVALLDENSADMLSLLKNHWKGASEPLERAERGSWFGGMRLLSLREQHQNVAALFGPMHWTNDTTLSRRKRKSYTVVTSRGRHS